MYESYFDEAVTRKDKVRASWQLLKSLKRSKKIMPDSICQLLGLQPGATYREGAAKYAGMI